MPILSSYNTAGLNQQLNPLAQSPGEFIQLINVDSQPFGAKTKRGGFSTYLNIPDAGTVNSLFNWTKNNGTQFWNYRASGSTLYYSQQGTGDWTICGNGTIPNGDKIFQDVLEDTLVITSPNGTTRHTTTGTSFTDTSSAPVGGVGVKEYQNRIWIAGTTSNMFYSTTGTPTDWTSDSSSIVLPGAGKLNSLMKVSDRLVASKNSGAMFKWDGFSLVDMATDLGPTSNQSIVSEEGIDFYLNRRGYFAFGGGKPEMISNPIQPQIYNREDDGINGALFETAPSGQFKYDVHTAVGTVTDSLTLEPINNALQVYNFQLDEWRNYAIPNFYPTAFATYKDVNGFEQFIFGDKDGQCYTFDDSPTDNGHTITSTMQMVYHANSPYADKRWKKIWLSFNPGCVAQVQVSCENTFHPNAKKWIPLGDAKSGIVEFDFPPNSRSKLLFIKITESSKQAPFIYYGCSVEYDIEGMNR